MKIQAEETEFRSIQLVTSDYTAAGPNSAFTVLLLVQRERHVHEKQADYAGEEECTHCRFS